MSKSNTAAAQARSKPAKKPAEVTEFIDKETFLKGAIALVTNDRNKIHGDAYEQLGQTADLWSAYLRIDITREQVSTCIELMKISRSCHGSYNQDDYFDKLGYGAISGEMAERERIHANHS
jgi:hypothetical protein